MPGISEPRCQDLGLGKGGGEGRGGGGSWARGELRTLARRLEGGGGGGRQIRDLTGLATGVLFVSFFGSYVTLLALG